MGLLLRELKEHKNDFIEFCGEFKKENDKKSYYSCNYKSKDGLFVRIGNIFSLCQKGLGLTTLLK